MCRAAANGDGERTLKDSNLVLGFKQEMRHTLRIESIDIQYTCRVLLGVYT